MHQRLVFTNGAFDLLHVGHVLLFETAKRYGDRLIVGVNTDASIGKYKPVKDGVERPIYGELERAMSVAALRAVDLVYLGDAPSWEAALEIIRPAFWVRGASYGQEHCMRMEDHPEGRVVTQHGGSCVVVPMAEDYSTTAIIRKIRCVGSQ
jgi:D-beta-D-heptose 7-phosphate kinase/D-beta-D-heptose 1-phosphate adenosyltransferase